jgi:hypothetical protein
MGKCRLSEVATVQMGYSFRSGLDVDSSGDVSVIQTKDLRDDLIVDLASLARVTMRASDSQLAHSGDIVLRSRGDSATSAIIRDEPDRAVVAAPLLRIRVTDPRVSAEYLNWFINQLAAQAYFSKNAAGSNVKMTSKRVVQDLEVSIPPPDRQAAVVELAELAMEEKRLRERVSSWRDQLLSEVTQCYVEGSAR